MNRKSAAWPEKRVSESSVSCMSAIMWRTLGQEDVCRRISTEASRGRSAGSTGVRLHVNARYFEEDRDCGGVKAEGIPGPCVEQRAEAVRSLQLNFAVQVGLVLVSSRVYTQGARSLIIVVSDCSRQCVWGQMGYFDAGNLPVMRVISCQTSRT